MHLDVFRAAITAIVALAQLDLIAESAAPGEPPTVGDVLPRFAPAIPQSRVRPPSAPIGSLGLSFRRPLPQRGFGGGGVQPSIGTNNEVRERVDLSSPSVVAEQSGAPFKRQRGDDPRFEAAADVARHRAVVIQGAQRGRSAPPAAFARPPLDGIAPPDFGEHSIPPPPTSDDESGAPNVVWPSRSAPPPFSSGQSGQSASRPSANVFMSQSRRPPPPVKQPQGGGGGDIDADGDDPLRMSATDGDRPLPGDEPDASEDEAHRPILPVRPPGRNLIASNWTIGDAAAAGLFEGETLDASQEGRCVVCG